MVLRTATRSLPGSPGETAFRKDRSGAVALGSGASGAPVSGEPRSESEKAPARPAPRARKRRKAGAVTVLKSGIWLMGLAPLIWAIAGVFTDGLGANPIEAVLHVMGRWGLVFLLLTLAVTPIRRFTGWNPIIKVRRLLGLFAFFYVTLHFLVYLVLDQGLAWSFIWEDIAERPFITVGFAAFVLMVPLAVTSTRGWIRRLGKRWQKLHRLVYPAAVLASVHFYWKVKADTFWPLVAGGILALLLLARTPLNPFGRRPR